MATGRVTTMLIRGVTESRVFYGALQRVFSLPTLEQLKSKEGIVQFLAGWDSKDNFGGPKIYYDSEGRVGIIITESSGRIIELKWHKFMGMGQDELNDILVIFPTRSLEAASQIIAAFRKLGGSFGCSVTIENYGTIDSIEYDLPANVAFRTNRDWGSTVTE